MARADRVFRDLVLVGVAVSVALAVPLAITLFPDLALRLVRGSVDTMQLCRGILVGVHTELPPFGAVALGLAVLGLVPAGWRLLRRLRARTRAAAPRRVPPRLRAAARRVGAAGVVTCVEDAVPYAYCAGLREPRIYVSAGAVRSLRRRELEAVLWHELHHLRRGDPKRALVARCVGAVFASVPLVTELVARFELVRELDADASALRAQGDPRGLAGALLALDPAPLRMGPIAVSGWSLAALRIDQLAGVDPRTPLPEVSRRAVAGTTLILAVLLALAVGQALRAHLLPAGLIREAAGEMAHVCPLPTGGPLL